MKVYAYDPYLSVDAAWKVSRRVFRVSSLNDLFKHVDYLTLHTPLTDETRGMIGKEQIAILHSKLSEIYDLSKIDWAECLDYAKSERVQEIADLWNDKLSLGEICEMAHLSRTNVRKHLLSGKQLGLCDYSVEESRLRGAKLNKKRKEELVTA